MIERSKSTDNQMTTEEKIMNAASLVFMKKGMDGARMQEIADEAGINKALLHYYFRNKEKLFDAVFKRAFDKLMPPLLEVFNSDIPILEKIPRFLNLHVTFLRENPNAPQFILFEIQRNPQMIMEFFAPLIHSGVIDQFKEGVQKSIEKGEIRPIDPIHLLVNIISMSVFPMVARNLIMEFAPFSPTEFDQFMEERKTSVSQFIIKSL